MPGRFFLQKFFREALEAGCDTVVLEMSSEGAKQFRHRAIALDAFIFLNLAPEHIESHGSYEKYRDAKVSMARQLNRSSKPDRHLIVNGDDVEHTHFVNAVGSEVSVHRYHLSEAEPYSETSPPLTFTFRGTEIASPLRGTFQLTNILAALTYCETRGVPVSTMKRALEEYRGTPGRVEQVETELPFEVYVDYAHTSGSLEALYKAFAGYTIIGVLGNAGGGRDTWKRPEMARVADQCCSHIILTNEDPYDEDPREIVRQMEQGIENTEYEVIMDRRQAIHRALEVAAEHATEPTNKVAVLITGKGTDPYIMGPNGSKELWNDRDVTQEELATLS